MLRSRRTRDGEHGQILVLFSLVLVVILAFASMVIDVGLLRNNRQTLVNALDSAALAGGTLLPVDGSVSGKAAAANSLITSTIAANYPGITSSDYTIAYKCLIGVDTNSLPYISRDVPLTCDPHFSLGHNPPVNSDFVGSGPTRYSSCNPSSGDKCNAVVITGATNTPFSFGRVVGVNQGSTGAVVSAACNGPCGASPLSPVDVVLVIDRTGSMDGTDTTNAKAAANAMVATYTPANQWLALGTIGPSQTGGSCKADDASTLGTANAPTDLRRWIPLGLSGTGSSVATNYSQITTAINCYPNSGTGTDLTDPMAMAAYELRHNGRTGVRKGIIFETDGQPNAAVASGPNYCALSNAAATAAKAAATGSPDGIEIFTIGFGLDAASGGDPTCPDTTGTWKNKTATALLASMATGPVVGTTTCDATENNDNDHFYCIGKTGASTDLTNIFKAAAAQLAKGGSRLVQLYPVPVVTAISPTAGTRLGNTTVTITGSFFSGATSVKFGGTAAPTFTVVSDTQITAKSPVGPVGTTVDITVTTPGGTTPQVNADQYTYN